MNVSPDNMSMSQWREYVRMWAVETVIDMIKSGIIPSSKYVEQVTNLIGTILEKHPEVKIAATVEEQDASEAAEKRYWDRRRALHFTGDADLGDSLDALVRSEMPLEDLRALLVTPHNDA